MKKTTYANHNRELRYSAFSWHKSATGLAFLGVIVVAGGEEVAENKFRSGDFLDRVLASWNVEAVIPDSTGGRGEVNLDEFRSCAFFNFLQQIDR